MYGDGLMMSLIKDFELKLNNSNNIDDVAALALVNKELSEGFKKEDLWNNRFGLC